MFKLFKNYKSKELLNETKSKELLNKTKSKELLNCEKKLQNTYGDGYRDITDLNNYDYIINILDIIHLLLAKKDLSKSSSSSSEPKKSFFKKIRNNINEFKSKYINMESTLKLLICEIAYLKNINFNDITLNEIYNNLLNITNVPEISKRMRIKIIFKEDHKQMRFLIILMGYIDSIMAKGKSEWGYQIGLKGHASTFNNVKKIDYHLFLIEYLFGIHGGLLQRYLNKTNYKSGALILKSLGKYFNKNVIPNNEMNKILEELGSKRILSKYYDKILLNSDGSLYKEISNGEKEEVFKYNNMFDKKYGLSGITNNSYYKAIKVSHSN